MFTDVLEDFDENEKEPNHDSNQQSKTKKKQSKRALSAGSISRRRPLSPMPVSCREPLPSKPENSKEMQKERDDDEEETIRDSSQKTKIMFEICSKHDVSTTSFYLMFRTIQLSIRLYVSILAHF